MKTPFVIVFACFVLALLEFGFLMEKSIRQGAAITRLKAENSDLALADAELKAVNAQLFAASNELRAANQRLIEADNGLRNACATLRRETLSYLKGLQR